MSVAKQSELHWHRLLSVGFSKPDTGFSYFDTAGLLLSQPQDLIVCQHSVPQSYLNFLKKCDLAQGKTIILETLGIDMTNSVAVALAIKKFTEKANCKSLNPYINSHFERKLAENLNLQMKEDPRLVLARDSKTDFYLTLGNAVRQPPSIIYYPYKLSSKLGLLGFFLKHGNLVCKAPYGVAGQGQVRIGWENISTLFDSRVLHKLSQHRPLNKETVRESFLVQKQIPEVTFSPSVQIDIKQTGQIDIVSIHIQRFLKNTFNYHGCRSVHFVPDSIVTQLKQEAKTIGELYFNSGYYGRVGLNAVVANDVTWWVEANLRQVMSSYAYAVARRLFPARLPYYTTWTYTLPETSSRDISIVLEKCHDILAGPSQDGVFPLHFYNLRDFGKITMQFVTAESQERCADLEKLFRERMDM